LAPLGTATDGAAVFTLDIAASFAFVAVIPLPIWYISAGGYVPSGASSTSVKLSYMTYTTLNGKS
jgi:hypothetical protein